jgi:hypothetical protein
VETELAELSAQFASTNKLRKTGRGQTLQLGFIKQQL